MSKLPTFDKSFGATEIPDRHIDVAVKWQRSKIVFCVVPERFVSLMLQQFLEHHNVRFWYTKPKDKCLVLFGGGGGEIEMLKRYHRQYISAEIEKKYVQIIRDRLKHLPKELPLF